VAVAAVAGRVAALTVEAGSKVPTFIESSFTSRVDYDAWVGRNAAAAKLLEGADYREHVTGATNTGSALADVSLNEPQDIYRLNMAHQEIERILKEVDDNCELVLSCAGTEAWLPIAGTASMVYKNLGYEDMDQMEDALGGTFMQFIDALPHMEHKIQDDGSSIDGQPVFRMVPPIPLHAQHGVIMTIPIRESKDLWKTLCKAPRAVIQIPALEFQIGGSVTRQIDSIFNHITTAVFNLGVYLRSGSVGGAQMEGIVDTIDQLTRLLDIPEPWELVIRDPTALSILKPDDGVVITLMDEPLEVAPVA